MMARVARNTVPSLTKALSRENDAQHGRVVLEAHRSPIAASHRAASSNQYYNMLRRSLLTLARRGHEVGGRPCLAPRAARSITTLQKLLEVHQSIPCPLAGLGGGGLARRGLEGAAAEPGEGLIKRRNDCSSVAAAHCLHPCT